jgi:hypothetical protein
LQQAVSLSKEKRCKNALDIAGRLGEPVAGLPFTEDGLKPFVESTRTRYLLGEVYASCGENSRAASSFAEATKTGNNDLLWAWAAARKNNSFSRPDWQERLLLAASHSQQRARQGNHEGWWHYTAGILLIAAGRRDAGIAELRECIVSPDENLTHYLARLALAGSTPR